jgi:hypothetical protein
VASPRPRQLIRIIVQLYGPGAPKCRGQICPSVAGGTAGAALGKGAEQAGREVGREAQPRGVAEPGHLQQQRAAIGFEAATAT